MSNIYTIAAGHRTLQHVEADSKAEARRVALADVTVTKLSASEAVDLTRRGIAIVSAKTGKVCNGDVDDDGSSPEIPRADGGYGYPTGTQPPAPAE